MRGSIEQRHRTSGTVYKARVSVVRNGERVWMTKSFSRKREAESWISARLAEEHKGELVLPSASTVGDIIERWLLTEASKQVRPGTLEDYERTVRLHLLPFWQTVRLEAVSAAAVQQWQQGALAACGTRTQAAAFDRLRQALDAAVRWGELRTNPVRSVKRPTVRREVAEPWDGSESRAFLAATAASRWHSLWHTALSTGLRLGELLGLTWEQVDFEGGTITVVQQVQVVRSELVVTVPKTKAARRTVRLTEESLAVLTQQRKEWVRQKLRAADESGTWVWMAAGGGPVRPTTVNRAWQAALKQAGARRIRFHDLRHTHATLLLAAGVSVPVVAQRLGHASPAITLSTYAHALPDGQEQATRAVGQVLHRA